MTGREQLIAIGKRLYGDKFSLNDTIRSEKYQKAYYYFLGDDTCQLDLSKGIAVIGSIGVGKSSMMRVMQGLFHSFQLSSSKYIINQFHEHGITGITKNFGYDRKMDLCIDDFGIDMDVKADYGSKFELFHELFLDRHELFVNEGFKLHMTSNLDPEDFKRVLGSRLYDRLKEMCNIIVWDGESLRK